MVCACSYNLQHERGHKLFVSERILSKVGKYHALFDLVDKGLHSLLWHPFLAHIFFVLFFHNWCTLSVELEEMVKDVKKFDFWVANERHFLVVVGDIGVHEAQEAIDQRPAHV